MSSEEIKAISLIDAVMKDDNISVPRHGSSNRHGSAFLDGIIKGVGGAFKAAGDYCKTNSDQCAAAGAAALNMATGQKRDGQKTQQMGRNLRASRAPATPEQKARRERTGKILEYMGGYQKMIGTMQAELATQGIITPKVQTEMIRNALAKELYGKMFTDSDQKATLVFIINKLDNRLGGA